MRWRDDRQFDRDNLGQFTDREYFTYHRTHDEDAIHIGAPIRGRAVDGWLIPVSRRFNRADGSFGGVASLRSIRIIFRISTIGSILDAVPWCSSPR